MEQAAVIGREFTAGAVNSLSGDQAVASTAPLAGPTGPHRAGPLADPRRRRLPLPPHPDPRRGLPRGREGEPSRAPRAVRRLARAVGGRAGRDHRLPPGAGVSLPAGARRAPTRRWRPGRRAAGPSGRRAVGRGDAPAAVTPADARRRAPARLSRRAARDPADPGQRADADRRLRARRARPDEALEAANAAGDRRLGAPHADRARVLPHPSHSPRNRWTRSSPSPTRDPAARGARRRRRPRKSVVAEERGALHACRWARVRRISNARSEHARARATRASRPTIAAQLAQALYYGPAPVADAIAAVRGAPAGRPATARSAPPSRAPSRDCERCRATSRRRAGFRKRRARSGKSSGSVSGSRALVDRGRHRSRSRTGRRRRRRCCAGRIASSPRWAQRA